MCNQHHSIRNRTLENLRNTPLGAQPAEVGQALLLALEQSGVDLKNGPSLEEVKSLLVDVSRALKTERHCDGSCTAA
jgi:hypothetical protein